jgi:hypothetical protein
MQEGCLTGGAPTRLIAMPSHSYMARHQDIKSAIAAESEILIGRPLYSSISHGCFESDCKYHHNCAGAEIHHRHHRS